MTDQDTTRDADQLHAGEDEPGLLTQQTPGLDEGETAAIAGPDWDDDLAEGAEGQPLDGEVESDGGASSIQSSVPPAAADSARGLDASQGGGTPTRLGDAPVGGIEKA
ncbi:MAG: hypothetical protein ACJ77B_01550 [Chloroflexota bacterium]